MSTGKWVLLGRLRRAVKKVKLLLNFNLNKWRIASMIGVSSSKRVLSFSNRPGLRACTDDIEDFENESGSSSSRALQRTMSFPSDDDVDKRAENFIANFRRHLQIERQVSLQLRYCRGNSFDSISP